MQAIQEDSHVFLENRHTAPYADSTKNVRQEKNTSEHHQLGRRFLFHRLNTSKFHVENVRLNNPMQKYSLQIIEEIGANNSIYKPA
ncbi:GTPase Der [Trichinella spiralis]|uniref:GTPase Der n=1 Tax=Trichinella spiralis TaxID=6334 RepID=A0ABR3KRE8_TRISP